MISPIAALYITSGFLEITACVLIAVKTYYKPKKIRCILLLFSVLTLPASAVNILNYTGILPNKWNSFSYLVSTTFMLTLHFWLNLDIGKLLRVGSVQYRNPLVLAGVITLSGSLLCLTCQTIILLVRDDEYPIKPAFVTGVTFAIFCDAATYLYSFSALINLRSQRIHEGQSRTTSLGVWFLLIQFLWYGAFGVLYVWFFCQTFEYFNTLLVFDYILRFILCLMFTWSPPRFVIEFMSGRFFSSLSQKSHSQGAGDTGSTFAITTDAKENGSSFGDNQELEQYTRNNINVNDLENPRANMYYPRNPTAMVRP
ncbi:hypothetical protein EDC94DRAFT_625171 [Helicostylum pulchrum]|nr:hypothetical protein EDC94DRAFT_625171 [Helicostylum pulchrum]